MTEPPHKYVYVTDGYNVEPRPGLGYMLVALSEAFFYAFVTNRALIVDWRDTLYLEGTASNLFTELFESPGSVFGVPVICEGIDELLKDKSDCLCPKSGAFVRRHCTGILTRHGHLS